MMKRTVRAQVRRLPFLWAVIAAAGACCPPLAAQAQESADSRSADEDSIDEIVVVVDRDGKPVDIDALRLEEARLKVIREFVIEQHKQEEELWRQKLRFALQRKSSRIAWGYDAQAEAARFSYSQANYLPMDRVRPATFVSIRF
ncbi:MAG: hypothetical protein OEM63_09685 [Gammaproteobacteria bacterium]|nr:hypothetical protein [Gammaproteobacteria bacterium]